MEILDIYVRFTFIVKIVFVLLLLADLYFKIKQKKQPKTTIEDKKKIVIITEWKEKTETLFIILMSLLIIYLFNPFIVRSVVLDYETKLLLFLFGAISIILRLKSVH
jgi:uncharacterized membrane protein YiaA